MGDAVGRGQALPFAVDGRLRPPQKALLAIVEHAQLVLRELMPLLEGSPEAAFFLRPERRP